MHVVIAAIAVVIAMRVRVDAFVLGLLQDHGVEPFSQRHARPARRFSCRLAGLGPYPFHAPRHAKFHARTTLRVEAPTMPPALRGAGTR